MRIDGLLGAALLLAAVAASAQTTYVPIEVRASAEQRRAAGLERLSAAELAALNALLRDEQPSLLSVAASDPSTDRREPPREAISGRIDGVFRGWSAGTDLRLVDGQVWRVVDGRLYTAAKDSPAVRIEPAAFGSWTLAVDGQATRAKVRRVK